MTAFNGRLVSALSADRLYRVRLERSEVLFIQVGGQEIGQAIALQFGLLGALIYAPLKRKSDARLKARIQDVDAQPMGSQLGAGEHDFRASASEIESSTLEPAAAIGGHGRHFGRWILQLSGRKPMTLQLESEADMRCALEAIPLAIPLHVNHAAWDAVRKKFTRTT